MITREDIEKRLDLTTDQVGLLYAVGFLPEAVRVGGRLLFREQDIAKLMKYLKARSKCRARGIDPDSVRGPAPPIYSTGGKPRFDPRLIVANELEAKRQAKSRTLAAGSAPIGPQQHVELPEVVADKPKVEG